MVDIRQHLKIRMIYFINDGGGMVEIDLNGKLEVAAVRIEPIVVEGGDVEMLQDLVMAAFTDGMAKVREAISGEVGSMAGGLNIPGFPGVA
jgi:DNA-binding YbaB/EbfC family protein